MHNVANHMGQKGFYPHQNNLKGYQEAALYTKEQSISTRENLNTSVVIQTREGDQVTLHLNSFSQMDAFMYDSAGVARTESGAAAFSYSQREISLASGKQFSFSVNGDLSEEELEDIDSLLKGLDEVIYDFKSGDLKGGLASALEIGGYDSFASYSANISYSKSYQMSSTVTAAATQTVPAGTYEPGNTLPPEGQIKTEGSLPPGQNGRPVIDFDKFFEKLLKKLEKHEDKQLGFAKNPINKLFQHHLEETDDDKENPQVGDTIKAAMDDIESFIDKKLSELLIPQPTEEDD